MTRPTTAAMLLGLLALAPLTLPASAQAPDPLAPPAFDLTPAAKPARNARKARRAAPAKARPAEVAPSASPGTVPMDFSGMSRSVNQLSSPTGTARSPTSGPEGTMSPDGSFRPGATFKF